MRLRIFIVILLFFSWKEYSSQNTFVLNKIEDTLKLSNRDSIVSLIFSKSANREISSFDLSTFPNLESLTFDYFNMKKDFSNLFTNLNNLKSVAFNYSKIRSKEISLILSKTSIDELIIYSSKDRIRNVDSWQYQSLSVLVLDNINTKVVSSIFNKLETTNLKTLSISHISGRFDESLLSNFCFKSLETVSINWSILSTFNLSKDCINSSRIEKLDLSNNNLNTFSISVSDSTLKFLDLSFNELEEFPSDIYKIRSLEYLSIVGNSINSISSEITKLINLKILVLPQQISSEIIEEIQLSLPNCKIYQNPKEIESSIPNYMR